MQEVIGGHWHVNGSTVMELDIGLHRPLTASPICRLALFCMVSPLVHTSLSQKQLRSQKADTKGHQLMFVIHKVIMNMHHIKEQ